MQPLALHLVNSVFLGDYLTSEGQEGKADLEMIADAGFEVEDADTTTLPEHRTGDAPRGGTTDITDGADISGATTPRVPAGVLSARTDLVTVRRRGAGTGLAPNA
jgi:biotin synthase